MTVAIGLGLTEFPFAGAGDYWRWVDVCEAELAPVLDPEPLDQFAGIRWRGCNE